LLDGNEIILIIDEFALVEINKRMLEKRGYDVLTANTGNEAISIFEKIILTCS